MVDEPIVGHEPHTRDGEPSGEKNTRCVACGDFATGQDARCRAPICLGCARKPPGEIQPGETQRTSDDTATVLGWRSDTSSPILEHNAPRRDTLAAVARYQSDGRHDRPYGLGVRAALEELYDQRVHSTQVYHALDDLVEADLLHIDPRNQRTNYYIVTDHGRRALATHAQFVCGAAVAADAVPSPHQLVTWPSITRGRAQEDSRGSSVNGQSGGTEAHGSEGSR